MEVRDSVPLALHSSAQHEGRGPQPATQDGPRAKKPALVAVSQLQIVAVDETVAQDSICVGIGRSPSHLRLCDTASARNEPKEAAAEPKWLSPSASVTPAASASVKPSKSCMGKEPTTSRGDERLVSWCVARQLEMQRLRAELSFSPIPAMLRRQAATQRR